MHIQYLTMSCEAGGSKVANQANHEPYPGDWYCIYGWALWFARAGSLVVGGRWGSFPTGKFKKIQLSAFQLIGSHA